MTGPLGMIFGAGPRFSRCPALFLAVFLMLAAVPAALADFRITEIHACLPDCPPALNQMKIVLISDLHLTAGNRSRQVFTALTDQINLLKPDVLLLAGDIFDGLDKKRNPEILAEVWDEFLGRLAERPPLGIYAVLGNHDKLRTDGEEIRALLKKSGVHVLADSVVPLRFQDATLYLAGTERRPKKALPKEFLEKITELRPLILMAHYPEIYDLVPDDAKILVVAGHTHGGVVHIPGLEKGAVVSIFSPKHRTKYVFGPYGGQDGKRLYVTAGIGGEGKSGHRINNPPEIVIIRPGEKQVTAPPPGKDPEAPAEN